MCWVMPPASRGDPGADVVSRGLAVVNMAHDGDDRRTILQILFRVHHIGGFAQGVFRRSSPGAIPACGQTRCRQGRRCRRSSSLLMLARLPSSSSFSEFRRLACRCAPSGLHRDGFRRHVGGFDLDWGHHLLGRHLFLAPGTLAAADHVVIKAALGPASARHLALVLLTRSGSRCLV